jgi:hypothetical protein
MDFCRCAKASLRAKDVDNNKIDIEMTIRFTVCPPENINLKYNLFAILSEYL